MSASTSESEHAPKVEKGPEGELKKTISTMTSSSTESTSTSKEEDKPTFRGPDSGRSKLYDVEELKKLKVMLQIGKKKLAASTSAAVIDPSSITPYRRPDQAKEKSSSGVAEGVGESKGCADTTYCRNEPDLGQLRIPHRWGAKRISENYQFDRAVKRCKTDRDSKECDAISYVMSRKLLRMDSDQAIYAECLINRVLERGLKQQLSSSTKIIDGDCVCKAKAQCSCERP